MTTLFIILAALSFGYCCYPFKRNNKKRICKYLVIAGIAFSIIAVFFLFLPQESKLKKLEEPTFSEELNKVSISLGNKGTFTTDISTLKEKPYVPTNLNGFKPVILYYSENNIYADVQIYGGTGLPPIQIKKNKIINKPPNWDYNSNKSALEIVNEKQVPMYQYIYKTPSHIIVNGIFPYPGGLMLAIEGGIIFNPSPSKIFSLKPIFKYPSWKYPGQYK